MTGVSGTDHRRVSVGRVFRGHPLSFSKWTCRTDRGSSDHLFLRTSSGGHRHRYGSGRSRVDDRDREVETGSEGTR